MDRHRITAALGETRIFTTLHEAVAAVRGVAIETHERDNRRIPPRSLAPTHRLSSNGTSEQDDSNPAIAISDAAAAPVRKPLAQRSGARSISDHWIIGSSLICADGVVTAKRLPAARRSPPSRARTP